MLTITPCVAPNYTVVGYRHTLGLFYSLFCSIPNVVLVFVCLFICLLFFFVYLFVAVVVALLQLSVDGRVCILSCLLFALALR